MPMARWSSTIDAGVLGDLQNALLVRLGGQHVQVGDQEEALVLVLQRQPVAVAADIVAEMQLAGRPVAGQDAFAFGQSWISSSYWFVKIEIGDQRLETVVDCRYLDLGWIVGFAGGRMVV